MRSDSRGYPSDTLDPAGIPCSLICAPPHREANRWTVGGASDISFGARLEPFAECAHPVETSLPTRTETLLASAARPREASIVSVLAASTTGTLIEWYDFSAASPLSCP